MDLDTLSLPELMALNKQVKDAIDIRKPNEIKKSKKVWLESNAAPPFRERIEALRKEYAKLSAKLNKNKSVVLRVQLDIDLGAENFDDILNTRWEHDFREVFDMACSGKLLNRDAVPRNMADEIQASIDSIMDDVCGDVAEIHGPLYKECEGFVDKLNELITDLNEVQQLEINAADLVPKKKKGKK